MWDPTAMYDASAVNDAMAIVFFITVFIAILVNSAATKIAYRRGRGDEWYYHMSRHDPHNK